MLLGVVSDTHGYFQPGLKKLFKGVDRILHAGDIDAQSVIEALEEIAPVTAVHGNVDRGLLAASYPAWLDMEVEGHRLLLIHRGGRVLWGEPTLGAILKRVQPDIVVYGHTHHAQAGWQDGAYYFNPGLGGRPRLGIRPSAGLLVVEPGRVEGAIHML